MTLGGKQDLTLQPVRHTRAGVAPHSPLLPRGAAGRMAAALPRVMALRLPCHVGAAPTVTTSSRFVLRASNRRTTRGSLPRSVGGDGDPACLPVGRRSSRAFPSRSAAFLSGGVGGARAAVFSSHISAAAGKRRERRIAASSHHPSDGADGPPEPTMEALAQHHPAEFARRLRAEGAALDAAAAAERDAQALARAKEKVRRTMNDGGCGRTGGGQASPEGLGEGVLPRGNVNGVEWASSRILALDERVPGWWTFPSSPSSDVRDTAWADNRWQTLMPSPLVFPLVAPPPQLLSVAPMMDYTTAHFRYLCRLLSAHTWLWTEMEVDQTLVHTDMPRLDRFLDFPLQTHPSVLQLGGSDPDVLGRATAIAAPYGYDEINLNCGCPSPKVAGKGSFGAALMLEPNLVAECVAAMQENSGGAPVTVKCRIGVDDVDSYGELCKFIETVAPKMAPTAPHSGPSENNPRPLFAIHARKALLDGLSPAENRTVPPLRHEWVYALARDFPEVGFVLNGGVKTVEEAVAVANGEGIPEGGGRLVGTMIGREAHANPWGVLGNADVAVYGAPSNPCQSRRDLLEKYADYCDATHGRYGTTKDGYSVPSIRHLMHPLQNLFVGEQNAKVWRREVDEALKRDAKKSGTTVRQLLKETIHVLSDETLDRPPGEARRKEGGTAVIELAPMPASVRRVAPAH